jgi:hypothetical protein
MTEAWRRSPHDVDPLSWFTGPLAPVVFGGIAVVFGTSATLLSMRSSTAPWLDWSAVACLLLAFASFGFFVRPGRLGPRLLLTGVPVVFGWLSLVLSALGAPGRPQQIELWWAPVGLAFVLAALAPYSSARQLLLVGTASSVVTAVVTGLLPSSRPHYWPPVTEIVLGAGSVLVATAAATVFSYQVVVRTQRWAASDTRRTLSSGVLGEAAKLRILRREFASVGERAVPLLQRVTESGVVTPEDREQALSLAEELRAELVERSNRSWLDSLATRMNLTVIDRERRADRMNEAQRAALLGLLRAATDDSALARPALVIELRGEADGSTAVALSTDVNLPDGRRLTLLAPHYLTLRATVDDLEWHAAGERLRMRFRLPPEEGATPR